MIASTLVCSLVKLLAKLKQTQLDGDLHAAELHIVHGSTVDNTLAVVGMFIDPKAAENNAEFDKILRGWEEYADETAAICNGTTASTSGTTTENSNATLAPTSLADEEATTGARRRRNQQRGRRLEAFNIYNLLAPGTGFYHYDGSLTTPPCSEIVWWSLADTNTKISVYQYNHLTSLVLEYVNRETCELATIATKAGTSSRPQQPLNDRIVKRICPTSAKDSAATDDADADGDSSSTSSSSIKKGKTLAAAAAAAAIAMGAAAAVALF
jgi:carbonic anhydrase